MLTISAAQRRLRLLRRHHLARETPAGSVAEATGGMIVLHATDPATVYVSALVRAPQATLDDVSAALYDDRSVVKVIAMRRTMFVTPTDFVPVVHSAAGLAIADRLRRQLIQHLSTLPTDPPVEGDVAAWLADVENGTEKAVDERGEALANELAKAEPRLRTAVLPTTDKKWDVKQNITSRVLALMGADGRIVRGRPAGTWLSRQHRWASVRGLWPDGLPDVPVAEARAELVRRWLRVFGPATVADVQWWTGWTLGLTRAVLAGLDTADVDLDGEPGVVLADDTEPEADVAPVATLLPALDPTPMGWQRRDWFLGPHRDALFDRNGNIGPTVWWGGWWAGGACATAPSGGGCSRTPAPRPLPPSSRRPPRWSSASAARRSSRASARRWSGSSPTADSGRPTRPGAVPTGDPGDSRIAAAARLRNRRGRHRTRRRNRSPCGRHSVFSPSPPSPRSSPAPVR